MTKQTITHFWQTIKPYLSEKGSVSDKVAVSRNDSALTSEKEVADTLNNYFISITKHLSL